MRKNWDLPCDAPLHVFVGAVAALGLALSLADFFHDVFKDPMPPTRAEQAARLEAAAKPKKPKAPRKPKAPPACTTAMGRYSTCLNLMAAYVPYRNPNAPPSEAPIMKPDWSFEMHCRARVGGS